MGSGRKGRKGKGGGGEARKEGESQRQGGLSNIGRGGWKGKPGKA